MWLEWVRKPWLSLGSTETLLPSGCFAANYWVNGQIMPKGGASWQPNDAVTDTPFQILKVVAYVKWLKEEKTFQASEDQRLRNQMDLLRDVWVCLIHQLDDLDKRKACAWPHTNEDGLNTYRLDDHFWLWSSLSELHDLGLWNLADAGSNSRKDSPGRWVSNIDSLSPTAEIDEKSPEFASEAVQNTEIFSEFSTMARRLAPKEVQRAVLQRFTVENDVSQERMLSVTRSARDTRFFFHTRDTALFYGHKRGFFRPDTSFGELWERTIKSQSQHEEALEEEKSSPLRFALGAIVGLNGFSLDKRSSAELTRRSVEDLVQLSAHNAFIPGEIDAATREPSIFSEERHRDYYYHVGFEVCHILLAFAGDIDVASRTEQIHSTSSDEFTKKFEGLNRQMQQLLDEFNEKQERLMLRQNQFMNPRQYSTDYRVLAKVEADGRVNRKRTSTTMKRSMPFNNMIDASSITVLDEEWLYNYPDFLVTKTLDLRHELDGLFDQTSARYRPINESVSSIIDKALESLERPPSEKFPFTKYAGDWEDEWTRDGLVVSLPKQKNRRQKRGTRDIGASLGLLKFLEFNESLWRSIGKARSAIKAKKRFIWLPARSNAQTALLCWIAATEAEKPAMSLFFDRHAEYDNHLWDDTTMVLNTWQTELHMCFWVIYDTRQKLHKGLPEPVPAPWPKNPYKELQRASIGFRFDGDFFDRYWTCHFIQYVPGWPIEHSNIPREWLHRFSNEKQSWQRKVLELQLLQHMLNLILTGSNQILNDIQRELGLGKGRLIFSVLTTEAYSSSPDHWQIYEELLEKAEEDVTSSLNTLSKWATRESDRGQEKPRWTRNDERKYRGYINKLRSHTERQRWDLENCRDKMCKLRETLVSRRDNVRADLEANREQNIRYFTYVTIIFLPLGFASSFYSMNGAPSNDLIVSLAKFAAAAFVVTAALVLSVSVFSPLGRKALSLVKKAMLVAISAAKIDVLGPIQRYSHNTRQHSLLVKGTSNDDELDETDSEKLHQAHSKIDWMTSRWFWLAYFLLELPTRTISSAWSELVAEEFSFGAVWKIAIGLVVLPVYLISRAVLVFFSNAITLLRISGKNMSGRRVHFIAKAFILG